MPVYRLGDDPALFPDPEQAEPEGLVAVGGDLSPERILNAYALGIFPWYGPGEPILWWCPDPRLVLAPDRLHVSRSLDKTLRRGRFRVTADRDFAAVIGRCARAPRPGQRGTWIVPEMQRAYRRLHELGFAHSVEAWEGETLAGGLYGLSLGGVFFGESMFADRTDASKVAFVRLVRTLGAWGFDLIDCQVETAHLVRFGARTMSRAAFRSRLALSLARPTRRGPWTLAGQADATDCPVP